MKLPCEIVVWYVAPVIKSELAKELSRRGMSQVKIAAVIDVTQAAVSQYLSKKRGSGPEITADMKKKIRDFADRVVSGGKPSLEKLICAECMIARKCGFITKCLPKPSRRA
jgi:predicted transcriptional regulator